MVVAGSDVEVVSMDVTCCGVVPGAEVLEGIIVLLSPSATSRRTLTRTSENSDLLDRRSCSKWLYETSEKK